MKDISVDQASYTRSFVLTLGAEDSKGTLHILHRRKCTGGPSV